MLAYSAVTPAKEKDEKEEKPKNALGIYHDLLWQISVLCTQKDMEKHSMRKKMTTYFVSPFVQNAQANHWNWMSDVIKATNKT